MGRDSKGVDRGKCSKPGCGCDQFLYKKENGPKCSNCGHVPVNHALIREAVLIKPSLGFASGEESDEGTNEETDEDDSISSRGSNRDIRGNLRGECIASGCKCRQFSCIKAQGPKCSVCGHAPVKHTQKQTSKSSSKLISRGFVEEEDEEFEKDSALFKPRNKNPPSPLKHFSGISISSSSLSITDMEEDSMDSIKTKKRLPINYENDSFKQIPHVDGYSLGLPTPLQSGVPKKKKIQNQSAIDSSMVPVYPAPDGYQLGSAFPAQMDASQGNQSSGSYVSQQQQQPFTSMLPSAAITVPAPAYPQHSPTTPQVIPQLPVTQSMPPQLFAQQPSVPSVQRMCKLAGCNKPVYVESSGRVHDFCGRTHAVAFNSNAGAAGVPAHLKCSNPSCKRIRYQENGKYFDFCGQSCRDSHRKLQQQQAPQILPGNTCRFPGCKKPRFFDTNSNSYMDYCGQTHANEAKKYLIKKADKQEFERIKAHFANCWDPRKGSCGQLHQVLVIDNGKLKDQFQRYHSSLSVKNIKPYFHGTSLKCAIYQTATVCGDTSCGICGISQKGMLPNFKAKNIKFQRFGNGFYLAPNSSKCHDYTQGYDKYRAMLLFDVAEGNKYVVKNDQTTLNAPPQGYDSVYGQHGGSLNYDEIVLYKTEALLPTHIVVYTKDGIHKIAK